MLECHWPVKEQHCSLVIRKNKPDSLNYQLPSLWCNKDGWQRNLLLQRSIVILHTSPPPSCKFCNTPGFNGATWGAWSAIISYSSATLGTMTWLTLSQGGAVWSVIARPINDAWWWTGKKSSKWPLRHVKPTTFKFNWTASRTQDLKLDRLGDWRAPLIIEYNTHYWLLSSTSSI